MRKVSPSGACCVVLVSSMRSWKYDGFGGGGGWQTVSEPRAREHDAPRDDDDDGSRHQHLYVLNPYYYSMSD